MYDKANFDEKLLQVSIDTWNTYDKANCDV